MSKYWNYFTSYLKYLIEDKLHCPWTNQAGRVGLKCATFFVSQVRLPRNNTVSLSPFHLDSTTNGRRKVHKSANGISPMWALQKKRRKCQNVKFSLHIAACNAFLKESILFFFWKNLSIKEDGTNENCLKQCKEITQSSALLLPALRKKRCSPSIK